MAAVAATDIREKNKGREILALERLYLRGLESVHEFLIFPLSLGEAGVTVELL